MRLTVLGFRVWVFEVWGLRREGFETHAGPDSQSKQGCRDSLSIHATVWI